MNIEPYRISFNGEKWVLYKRELCAHGMWNPFFEHEHFKLVELYLKTVIREGHEGLNPPHLVEAFYDEVGLVTTYTSKKA